MKKKTKTKLPNNPKPPETTFDPYKLDDKLKTQILGCYASGLNKQTEISEMIGVDRKTLGKWLAENLITKDEIFRARISSKLNAQNVLFDAIAKIDKAQIKPADSISAAKFILERKHSDEWGQKIEHKVKIEIVQKVIIMVMGAINNVIKDPGQKRLLAGELDRISDQGDFNTIDAAGDSEDGRIPGLGEEKLSDSRAFFYAGPETPARAVI